MRRARGLTQIQIRIETREKLKEIGCKGETYDDIINRLIDHYLQEAQR